MNKRFWIICSVIGLALLTLSVLGLSSLKVHRKVLQADRQQVFMEVAKKISFDVKKKVDAFLQTEQRRPYTDYQPYYVPEVGGNAAALVPSPLAGLYSNNFATGYFQLESDGQLTSPHFAEQVMQVAQQEKLPADHSAYFDNVRQNLLPSLASGQTIATHRVEPTERENAKDKYSFDKISWARGRRPQTSKPEAEFSAVADFERSAEPERDESTKKIVQKNQSTAKSKGPKAAPSRRSVYPISTQEETRQTTTQVITQRRDNYDINFLNNAAVQIDDSLSEAVQSYNDNRLQQETLAEPQSPAGQQSSFSFSQPAEVEAKDSDAVIQKRYDPVNMRERAERQQEFVKKDNKQSITDEMMMGMPEQAEFELQSTPAAQPQAEQDDVVQIRIEPFVPMTVAAVNGNGNGLFAGQVFLLRHVQIEDRHLVQGFRLNEDKLLTQIAESARERLGLGMGYEISKAERPDAAHTAVLQFDFGEVILNLLELEPTLIQAQVLRIRNWFFGILGVVWLAVLAAMAALWKNMHEQIALSRKKDDFISAVSHELRTPLTSIRMYTEMLEKDWVKTDAKRREYYTTMRTESERLSRLVENVLDFSRIQRGKKRYDFTMGDINACIGEVAGIMQPYIERAGFTLIQELAEIAPFMFDRDAVAQIVINLVDNALKYAKTAADKQIILRTRQSKETILIEIEDHGPGISRSQQKKIFDAFYRCEDESTRQSTGTGLGLALVKRFAEAHHGFVEIAGAKPTGALFRVGLTIR